MSFITILYHTLQSIKLFKVIEQYLAYQSPQKEIQLFHIWLWNSGMAILIMHRAQTHFIRLNLD